MYWRPKRIAIWEALIQAETLIVLQLVGEGKESL